LPNRWRVVKFKDIAKEMYYGLTAKAVNKKTSLRMLRTTDIKDYRVNWDALPYAVITEKSRKNISRYLLRKNDLIISRAGTAGVAVLVPRDFNDVIFGSYLIKVRLDENLVDPLYVYYYCQSNLYWNQIRSGQAGSTLKNINLRILNNILIPLPPLDEQRKIARILCTVDEAIAKTDTIISRVEELRRALLDYLMTHGIGHKEYKETEIGKIPKEWKVVKNGDVAKIDTKSIRPKAGEKYYYIGLEDIESQTGRILKNENELVDGSQIKSTKYVFSKEHVLYGRLRPYLNKVALPIRDGICSTDILPILPNKNLILREYLAYLMRHPRFVEWATSRMKGTNHPRISSRDILEYRISLPPIDEQKKIVEIISSVETLRDIELQKKEQLTALKSQLINLLLTDKVRAKDLPID